MKKIKYVFMALVLALFIAVCMFTPDLFFRYVDYKSLGSSITVADNQNVKFKEKEITLSDKMKIINQPSTLFDGYIDSNDEAYIKKCIMKLVDELELDKWGIFINKDDISIKEITKMVCIPVDADESGFRLYKTILVYDGIMLDIIMDESTTKILSLSISDEKCRIKSLFEYDCQEVFYSVLKHFYGEYNVTLLHDYYGDSESFDSDKSFNDDKQKDSDELSESDNSAAIESVESDKNKAMKGKSFLVGLKYLLYNENESFEYMINISESQIIFNG